jgi:hypothetical protein
MTESLKYIKISYKQKNNNPWENEQRACFETQEECDKKVSLHSNWRNANLNNKQLPIVFSTTLTEIKKSDQMVLASVWGNR